jgi:hypothetical protein
LLVAASIGCCGAEDKNPIWREKDEESSSKEKESHKEEVRDLKN